MTYPCTGCGLCCHKVDRSISSALVSGNAALMAAALRFPYRLDPSGTCEKLVGDQCSVYETRPLLCRIDELTDHLGDMKEHAIKANIRECNAAIKAAGLDPSYLIQV